MKDRYDEMRNKRNKWTFRKDGYENKNWRYKKMVIILVVGMVIGFEVRTGGSGGQTVETRSEYLRKRSWEVDHSMWDFELVLI